MIVLGEGVKQMSRGEPPELECVVFRCRDEPGTVVRGTKLVDGVRVSANGAAKAIIINVPDFQCPLLHRGDQRVFWTEGDTLDGTSFDVEGVKEFALAQIPYFESLVLASRSQESTCFIDGHTIDELLVCLEGWVGRACVELLGTDHTVLTTRDGKQAIRRYGDGVDHGIMWVLVEELCGVDIVHIDTMSHTVGDEIALIWTPLDR